MKKKTKNFLIIIDGPIGAGKTATSDLLLKKLKNTAKISLDKIKRYYSDFDNDNFKGLQLASEVGALMTKFYLNKGINVLVEKAFTHDKYLKDFIKKTNSKEIRKYVYQIEAPLNIRIKRVKQREKERKTENKLTISKIKLNNRNYLYYKYADAKVFDSSKFSANQIANKILTDITK